MLQVLYVLQVLEVLEVLKDNRFDIGDSPQISVSMNYSYEVFD